MCVEFTELNKACPKNDYPFSKIDRLVDSTAGHALLNFMDANASYHQILLAEEDQPHTAFITSFEVYCYSHAFWTQKRRSNIPENGKENVQCSNWKKLGSLCG